MLRPSLLQVLALAELLTFTTSTPLTSTIQGISDETTPVNDTQRYDDATAILETNQFDSLENERNFSTKVSVNIQRVAVTNVTLGADNTTTSTSGQTNAVSRAQAAVAAGTVQTTKLRTKRDATQESMVLNGVTWPYTTRDNATLNPIQRVGLNTVMDLARSAKTFSVAQFANVSENHARSSYSFRYGAVTLAMASYNTSDGENPLNWSDFGELADWLLNATEFFRYPKSYVGNICSEDNSTILAEWGVTWSWEETWVDTPTGLKIWSASSSVQEVTTTGGKTKRHQAPQPGTAIARLHARDMDDTLIEYSKPVIVFLANTGFHVLIRQGVKAMTRGNVVNLFRGGASGMWFDQMVSTISEGRTYSAVTDQITGPYYLEAHYLPRWAKRFMDDGIHIAMKDGFAASEDALMQFFETLKNFAEANRWGSTEFHFTKTLVGEILNPLGQTVGIFSVGEKLTSYATKIAASAFGGSTVGQFVRIKDEL